MENLIVIPESRLKELLQEVLLEHDSKKKSTQPEKLYTINQVRKRLGLSFETVKRMVEQGILPTTSDGHRIPESSVENYLKLKK
jgi:excisionase family DNA binding protein